MKSQQAASRHDDTQKQRTMNWAAVSSETLSGTATCRTSRSMLVSGDQHTEMPNAQMPTMSNYSSNMPMTLHIGLQRAYQSCLRYSRVLLEGALSQGPHGYRTCCCYPLPWLDIFDMVTHSFDDTHAYTLMSMRRTFVQLAASIDLTTRLSTHRHSLGPQANRAETPGSSQ